MNEVKLKAFAKINLGLDVVARRPDGYHEVRMIMQTVKLYDKLKLAKSEINGITLKTNLSYLPVNENNLVYRTIRLLQEEFGIEEGVTAELEKRIPVAAGLAGGSTDAAAALVGMNRLFELGLSKKQLMERAVKLGADVPYCILRGTVLSEGIGEILTPLPAMPDCFILLVKPGISVSTKYVYQNLKLDQLKEHPDIDGMIKALKNEDLYGLSGRLSNVLETVTEKEYLIIGKIKKEMLRLGALNAIMSGSGPTVFGLFDEERKAEDALRWFKVHELGKQIFLTTAWNRKRGQKNE